jgi:hypothetical protein
MTPFIASNAASKKSSPKLLGLLAEEEEESMELILDVREGSLMLGEGRGTGWRDWWASTEVRIGESEGDVKRD